MQIVVNPVGQFGEIQIADYADATGRYYILVKDMPAARALVIALRQEMRRLPALPGWLAIPYSRAVDGVLVDLVQVVGHLLYGRHEMRQLTLTDEEPNA